MGFDPNDILEHAEYGEIFGELPDADEFPDIYFGRRVRWGVSPGLALRVQADRIVAMPLNRWYPNHLQGLYDTIEDGDRPVFEAPSARVYKVTEADVREQGKLSDDELAAAGWQRPMEKSDIGHYYAVLMDGNHRAFAAIAAGEPYIYVYVAGHYRDNVDSEDLE